jgi:hypothetical protein
MNACQIYRIHFFEDGSVVSQARSILSTFRKAVDAPTNRNRVHFGCSPIHVEYISAGGCPESTMLLRMSRDRSILSTFQKAGVPDPVQVEFQNAVDVMSPIHMEYISEGGICPEHGAVCIMPKHVTFDHLVGDGQNGAKGEKWALLG